MTNKLPSSFLDGSHLSMLFTFVHSKNVRGEKYAELKNSHEMALFSFLKDNLDLEINVENIIKMYSILINDEKASFRKNNLTIDTGKKFYVPTSIDNIQKEMEQLCEGFKHLNHPKEEDFDDIIKFILQFICIHPFSNGNGRISVFLTELLLSKFGLKSALYIPFDALLNGIYINKTTEEIRKASGFFYKMKDYQYDSYTNYMKGLLMKSYDLLLKTIEGFND